MVGSAIARVLKSNGYNTILAPSHAELDYIDQQSVRSYLQKNKPDVIVIAAAKVGGIYANMSYPAEFLYQNLMIECNLIHEAHICGINHLLFLGSTCIYPKLSAQPIDEHALLTGPLEPTNEAYALAKICGIKLCSFYRKQYGHRYICAMPTNLYGPGDNYHPDNSHVIPGLIKRFHDAKVAEKKEVEMWGSGNVFREFLYVDDLADACFYLLKHYDDDLHINLGSPDEISIKELAHLIAKTIGYKGKITHDLSKPDGTPRKKSNLTRITNLGWKPKVELQKGLCLAYNDFLKN